jgi:phenylalanyl-tRNA synthetase beta subunit
LFLDAIGFRVKLPIEATSTALIAAKATTAAPAEAATAASHHPSQAASDESVFEAFKQPVSLLLGELALFNSLIEACLPVLHPGILDGVLYGLQIHAGLIGQFGQGLAAPQLEG